MIGTAILAGMFIGAVWTMTVLYLIMAAEEKRQERAEIWTRHKSRR